MGRSIAVLLRAVNVGGHNRVPMAALRDLLGELGHPGARTYLQSGNAVLDTVGDAPDVLEAFRLELRGAIKERFGVDQPVMTRTRADLESLADRNPYLGGQPDPAKLHVVFLASTPDEAAVERVNARSFPPDEFTVDGDTVFVHYPQGAGRSKLRVDLGIPATARNWRTVSALLEMM